MDLPYGQDVLQPTRREIELQLEAICSSREFDRCDRAIDLLRYIVGNAEQPDKLKGAVISIEVFGDDKRRKTRPRGIVSTSPQEDAIVQVSVSKLRAKLKKYYKSEGQRDHVNITIPVGAYVPHFSENPNSLQLNEQTVELLERAWSLVVRKTIQDDDRAFISLKAAHSEQPNHPRILAEEALITLTVGRAPGNDLPRVQSIIDKIKASGVELWECHLADAWIRAVRLWDWADADSLFREAIMLRRARGERDPSYLPFHAAFLASQGRFAEAITVTKEGILARRFDSTACRADLALYETIAGQYEAASSTISTAISQVASKVGKQFALNKAILAEAKAESNPQLYLDPPPSWPPPPSGSTPHASLITLTRDIRSAAFYHLFQGLGGDRQSARAGYENLRKQHFMGGESSAVSLGLAAMGAGIHDEAVEWFSRAAERHCPFMIWLAVLPFFRHLHGHAGFQRLVNETMQLRFPKS